MFSIANALNRAAELVETNGLHKGAFTPYGYATDPRVSDDECPRCAEGAIFKAIYDEGVESIHREECFWYVRQSLGVESIHRWNDNPNRTKEDVVEALRKAAQLAEVPLCRILNLRKPPA